MKAWHLVLWGVIGSLAACAYTTTHRVVTGQPGPPHTGEVAVYMAGVAAPPYEEVAIVQAVGQGAHADLEHVVTGLKREAAKLGCNTLANVKIDQGSGTASGTAICARVPPTTAPHSAPPSAPAPAPTPAPPSTPVEVQPTSTPDAAPNVEGGE